MDKYHADIDMQGNMVKNLAIEKSDTFPATPSDGQIYIKSGILYWWDADISEWVSTPGAGVFQGGFNAGIETSMPTAMLADWWHITHQGDVGGNLEEDLKPGDIIVANMDAPGNDEDNWTVIRIERDLGAYWEEAGSNVTPTMGRGVQAANVLAAHLDADSADIGSGMIEVISNNEAYIRPPETEGVLQPLGVYPSTHGTFPLRFARVKKASFEDLTLSGTLRLTDLGGFDQMRRMLVVDNEGFIYTDDASGGDAIVGKGIAYIETGSEMNLNLQKPTILVNRDVNFAISCPEAMTAANADVIVRKMANNASSVTIHTVAWQLKWDQNDGNGLTTVDPQAWVHIKGFVYSEFTAYWIVVAMGGAWTLITD